MNTSFQISSLESNDLRLSQVALLAEKIWQQHFTPLIGEQQVAYMLDKFQSEAAMRQQINDGVEYFMIADSQPCGYMALIDSGDKDRMMLSKLYVAEEYRGQGVGYQLLNFAEEICRQRERQALWLTVNRDNSDSISWYQWQGFTLVDEVKKDIGNGFFMDDFVMQKAIV